VLAGIYMDKFITYEGLPVNSGGSHSLGKKKVEIIYADTLRFLKTFTDTDIPTNIDLIFYSSQTGTYKTLPNIWKLIRIFGIPHYDSWKLRNIRQHFFTWKLKYSDCNKAFKVLDDLLKLPTNGYGPIVFSFYWKFNFVDPVSKKVLEGQDKIPVIDFRQHNSQLYLRLGQRSTISVWFAFPFQELNEKNREYISSVSTALPFKPSDKNWRLWRKSKTDNWNPQILDINAS
jgi:hypothetical protein